MVIERSTGTSSSEMVYDSLSRVSTIDGRDAPFTRELVPFLSEEAFHKYRAIVEVEALIALSESDFPGAPILDEGTKSELRGLISPEIFDPKIVAEYDHIGRLKDGEPKEARKKPLEHDVKAVELYLGELFDASGHSDLKEWIHFAVTSEDINNITLNLMLRDTINNAWLPQIVSIMDRLAELAEKHADSPVLGRTHLKPASPTTWGKRFSIHLANMMEIAEGMGEVRLSAKLSGSVGNYNSTTALAPEFDYEAFAKDFVERFGMQYLESTGQTNNHIAIVDFLSKVKLMNTAVANLSENVRLGILLEEIVQIPKEGQIGSSVMPHKVNPWRLESGEGNIEKSSSLIGGAVDGLIKTQLERDSSDHPWERGYGEMLGMSLAGLSYISEDLEVIVVNGEKTKADLDTHYEVLAEPLQIAGRMEGDPESYMRIKDATQGKQMNQATYMSLVLESIKDLQRQTTLLNLTPSTYVGHAPEIARATVEKYRKLRTRIERGILDEAKSIDAVLFDFDNTLQVGDKDELIARITEIVLQMELDFTPEEIVGFGNRSDWKEMKQLITTAQLSKNPDAPITMDEIEAVNKGISGTLDHHFRLADGAKETLQVLRDSGKKLGLVTTRGSNSLMRLLQMHGIEGFFDVIINRDDAGRRKPHPEPIAKALERIGIEASDRLLYVGDKQEDDIGAGNALGLKTALISDEEYDPYGAKPTYRLKSLQDLKARFGR